MFNEKEKNSNRIETLIGEHCTITGGLSGCGLLRIDGTIEGTIRWQDDVETSETSFCKGNITCFNAIIGGKVEGNLSCQGTLTIESSASVTGDICVKNLRINDGGVFDGKCVMLSKNEIPSMDF
ncbi:MAG: polymer-forming cytoskeletal protein [Clostridiaceae bacterium]|nr:polymer-forming cytoskeletal protein [Clostridiaceae bacterium]